ncbi:hypothetical protein [Streptomyces shenzhenensis]|uniref:hypothetical protein n=1 Tax=Streptomyces shenzhenensis TaxID=943815 RepID=UPI00367DF793
MSPLPRPDTKAIVRAAEALTAQVRRIADALKTPVTTSAPEADMQRLIALYERWVKPGPPPPVGMPLFDTSMSRWWDERLVELHDAILPAEHQAATDQPTGPS